MKEKGIFSRALRIPAPLRELHGDDASLGELLLVYGGGAGVGGLVLLAGRAELDGLAWWRFALLILVTLDLAGGAIANLAPGTRAYWRGRGRAMRALFVAVHAAQPALLGLALGGPWPALAFLYAWLLGAAILLVPVRDPARPLAAMGLSLAGMAALRFFFAPGPLVELLGTIYLIKLVYGFLGADQALAAQAGQSPQAKS